MRRSVMSEHNVNTKYGVLLVAVLAATTTAAATAGGCVMPIGSKEHFTYQWPLVYNAKGELYPTVVDDQLNTRKVVVGGGENVLLSCAPNYVRSLRRASEVTAKCNALTGNFTLPPHAADVELKALTCDLRVIEQILQPVELCTRASWTAVRYGYVDPASKQTLVLGEACYDAQAGRTLFAHVKLGDPASSYLQTAPAHYLTRGRHPDGRYKVDLFRGLHFDEIYERIRSQLHVKRVPQLKLASYIDEALLPNAQLQAVKKLGWNYYVGHDDTPVWEELKQDIRALSGRLDMDVYVGGHGVHALHGANNERMEVYLHGTDADTQRFPMPAFMWIVVKRHEKATAFVVTNDVGNGNDNNLIRSEDAPQRSHLCESSCAEVSWLREALKSSASSVLACCAVADFQKIGDQLPAWTGITAMLL